MDTGDLVPEVTFVKGCYDLCDAGPGITMRQEAMAYKKKSYAEAVATPTEHRERPAIVTPKTKYTILLESTDPTSTGEDIIKEMKTSIDVVEMGIGIASMRATKYNKIVIACDTNQEREKLSEALKQNCSKLTASLPTMRNPMVRFIGITPDMTNEKVVEAVSKQNNNLTEAIPKQDFTLKPIRCTKGRTSATRNIIMETSPLVWSALINKKVKIGYLQILVVDQSPVYQCFKCSGYGHKANNCPNTINCGFCSEKHDTRNCPNRKNTPRCVNCCQKEETEIFHTAYSKDCPEWRKADRFARMSVRYC
ncbi:uncharacterized protein LOC133531865 [Cydia pomonella]|uniref:uncharacterized protein LOC133531865 n=1 Tax=Cydia pomonella TaxID=82600 RepID=UPI002ADDE226|nr:uncharacterized protein LOC133531865 [Cydia pomonella]